MNSVRYNFTDEKLKSNLFGLFAPFSLKFKFWKFRNRFSIFNILSNKLNLNRLLVHSTSVNSPIILSLKPAFLHGMVQMITYSRCRLSEFIKNKFTILYFLSLGWGVYWLRFWSVSQINIFILVGLNC